VHPDVAFVYVRDLIERLTGDKPEPDADGDLPVRYQGAVFFVRVVGPVGYIDPWVQVFSVAVSEIEATPELMVALNEVNRDLRFARAFHIGTQVLIESELWTEDLTPENFSAACRNVAGATEAFAPRIVERFGGKLLFGESRSEEATTDASEEQASAPEGDPPSKSHPRPPGPYL
jgi:hypothetical protein